MANLKVGMPQLLSVDLQPCRIHKHEQYVLDFLLHVIYKPAHRKNEGKKTQIGTAKKKKERIGCFNNTAMLYVQ